MLKDFTFIFTKLWLFNQQSLYFTNFTWNLERFSQFYLSKEEGNVHNVCYNGEIDTNVSNINEV